MEQLDWTEGWAENPMAPRDRIEPAARKNRPNAGTSWVDAVVTLLATILFGLGWTLVELERALPLENGYAGPTAWETVASPDPGGRALESLERRDGAVRWTELAQRSSKR